MAVGMGIRIFVHAMRMVFGNLRAALRIGGVALVVLLALGISAGLTPPPGALHGPSTAGMATNLLLTIARVIVGLWVAVAWHRFILLEETPGALLPRWNGAAIWAYVKAGVVLALIVLLIILPIAFVGGLLMVPMTASMATSASPRMLMALIGFIIALVPACYIFFRLAPVLPAAAVGSGLSLREAWFQTSPGAGALAMLTLVSIVASWLVQYPGLLIAGVTPAMALIWITVVQWLVLMVGVSIVTTIYGHYVEKRDLNA